MTVKELIDCLQKFDPDLDVRTEDSAPFSTGPFDNNIWNVALYKGPTRDRSARLPYVRIT